MASMAESSVASLPLALLQEKRRGLEQYAADHDADTNTATNTATNTSPRPPPASAAPHGGSPDVFHRLATSFGGGDTQELPSPQMRGLHRVRRAAGEPDTLGAGAGAGDTPAEGDGLVDFADFPPSSPHDADVFLEDTQPPATQPALPSAAAVPATPALQRASSSRASRLLTSAATDTTAGVAQAFAFDAAHTRGLTGTQAFRQTQQPSSSPGCPPPESDPIASRPEFQRTSSPPALPDSSPAAFRRPPPRAGEPRDAYVSKEEEQRRRAEHQRLQEERRLASEGDLGESDERDTQDRKFRARIRRLGRDRHVLGTVRAPLRSGSRLGSARKADKNEVIDVETPETARKRWDKLVDNPLGDDEGEEEHELPEPVTESIQHSERDEPGGETDGDEGATGEAFSEHDEYDELNGVLMSQRHSDEPAEHGHLDRGDDVEMPDHEAEPHDHPSRHAIPQSPAPSTVADSQPMQDRPVAVQQVMQSSNLSFVPGSQYRGRTSQDMAVLKSQPAAGGGRVAASQPPNGPDAVVDGDHKIPSSPPVHTANGAVSDSPVVQPDIPESDRPDGLQSRPFSTARIHVSASAESRITALAPSPTKRAGHQRSESTDPSPSKAARLPHFSDIAKGPMTSNPSFESQNLNDDIEEIMNGIYTDEDKKHMRQVSSPDRPRTKRQKLAHISSSRSASSFGRHRASRENEPEVGGRDVTDVDGDVDMQGDGTRPGPGIVEQADEAADMDQSAALEAPHDHGEEREADALRESPTKANELPPTVQSSPNTKHRETTPETVREREDAGRSAVSQLVATRSTAFVKRGQPATDGRTRRRTSTAAGSKKKGKPRNARPATPEQSEAEEGEEQQDRTAASPSDAPSANAATDLLPLPDEAIAEDVPDVIAPERVFALFRGNPQNFYPATYLGGSADGMAYKIQFDDGTRTQIDTFHVRRLDLRIGDVVKVDEPEMRKKNWRITGFGPVATSQAERDLGTDVFGRSTIKVQVSHASRNSVGPGTTPGASGDGGIKDVPVHTVYITSTMWPKFRDRIFSPPASTKAAVKPAETPSTRPNTPPTVDTPASRSRRAPAPNGKAKASGGRPSHLRETSGPPSSSSHSSAAIFCDMAFAISYVDDHNNGKAEVTRLIQRNGGTVVDGFHELFELPNLDGSHTTWPSKKIPPREQAASHDGTRAAPCGLQLKDKYQTLRFAACISDCHSRRAKYIQALALGLPTISGRWITHCLDASKNPSLLRGGEAVPIPWGKYLLPAGESTYLGGSIRSRTLTPYDASQARLATTIADRATNLLHGEGLLLVAPRKGGGGSEEKRKTFTFLTLALGAGRVQRVPDLAAAKQLATAPHAAWTWVYADGPISPHARAEILRLTPAAAGPKKRKRKRSSAAAAPHDDDRSSMFATDGTLRLVNDEFVIQSLILGALAHE